LDTIAHAKEKVVDLSVEFGPKVLAAALIMVVGFFASRWVVGAFPQREVRLLNPPA